MSDEPETPPPNNKKKLGLIAGGVVLLLGVVGGGLWASGMLGGSGEASAAEGEHGEAAAEGEGEGKPAEGEGEAKGEGEGEAKAEGGHGAVASEGAAAVSDGIGGAKVGSVITNLGSFTVNLRGSGGGRVLRMEVQLDSNNGTAAVVGARGPQLRDSVITAVSDYTWSELEGVDGKTRLRDELLARLNGIVTPNVVDHLYFTQFVVQ
jgi:flagellar basal body-associated protein FliL